MMSNTIEATAAAAWSDLYRLAVGNGRGYAATGIRRAADRKSAPAVRQDAVEDDVRIGVHAAAAALPSSRFQRPPQDDDRRALIRAGCTAVDRVRSGKLPDYQGGSDASAAAAQFQYPAEWAAAHVDQPIESAGLVDAETLEERAAVLAELPGWVRLQLRRARGDQDWPDEYCARTRMELLDAAEQATREVLAARGLI
jgi:hypothetical protein